jgi:NAD(P)-dependent dehydrogenase (short-subunit alcohol dehydrogenase family)
MGIVRTNVSMSAPNPFSLTGRTAFVTGAGRGIGRAIALALAEAGADIAVMARSEAEIRTSRDDIRALGRNAVAVQADVRDEAQVREAIESCVRDLGPVDILVNNAGNLFYQPLVPLPGFQPESHPEFREAATDDALLSVLDTHLMGALRLSRAVAPAMIENHFGRIINITSVSLLRVASFNSAYDAAKGGLAALTRSLAREWARFGITVNSIAPGQFHTEMTAELHESDEGRQWLMRRIPMKRTGEVRELGLLAVYLASPAASFVTGQVIFCDGGETL